MSDAPRQTTRLDKWLWHARFFKTRGRATEVVAGGHVRVNAQKVSKPAQAVGAGDTLTFPQGRRIRVVRILGLADRRGPAPEAQALYDDLSPPEDDTPAAPRFDGGGRPTGRDRRKLSQAKGSALE
ncbi:MAG: RNA-binding S4 domain-containing protein [Paracoccaceae bacterium]